MRTILRLHLLIRPTAPGVISALGVPWDNSPANATPLQAAMNLSVIQALHDWPFAVWLRSAPLIYPRLKPCTSSLSRSRLDHFGWLICACWASGWFGHGDD